MAFNISDVYRAFWPDRSKEKGGGGLPLPQFQAYLVLRRCEVPTAFFAMYVAFAASKLWDITALHAPLPPTGTRVPPCLRL